MEGLEETLEVAREIGRTVYDEIYQSWRDDLAEMIRKHLDLTKNEIAGAVAAHEVHEILRKIQIGDDDLAGLADNRFYDLPADQQARIRTAYRIGAFEAAAWHLATQLFAEGVAPEHGEHEICDQIADLIA